jgi:hypothetical protein
MKTLFIIILSVFHFSAFSQTSKERLFKKRVALIESLSDFLKQHQQLQIIIDSANDSLINSAFYDTVLGKFFDTAAMAKKFDTQTEIFGPSAKWNLTKINLNQFHTQTHIKNKKDFFYSLPVIEGDLNNLSDKTKKEFDNTIQGSLTNGKDTIPLIFFGFLDNSAKLIFISYAVAYRKENIELIKSFLKRPKL